MEDIANTVNNGARDYSSALISGGMNENFHVPIERHIDKLEYMKKWGWKLNLHTGLMDEETIKKIAPFAEKISFDFTVDDHTIKNVYHCDKKGNDFIRTFEILRKYTDTVPHLTIGLLGGEIHGEYAAIEKLSQYKIKKLVFIVFIPTKGSDFEKNSPPDLQATETFLSAARNSMPDTEFVLGCMRPRGSYSEQLESICLKYEFNSIVIPGKNSLEKIRETGCKIITKRECCIL